MGLFAGSKDNISCIVAHLPGVYIGDPSLGGVLARRDKREKERIDRIEEDQKLRDDARK